MYQISEAYKKAMKAVEQEHVVNGTIGSVPFAEKNILRGSFSITNQCSDNSEIKIGQVYIGELKATFIDVPVSRSSWKGLDIKAFFSLRLFDKSYETIPLGIFTVSEAEWTSSGVVVTAFDRMARFDKKYNGKQMIGKAYDLILIACEQCSVPFGMTEEEVKALPNGDVELSVYSENDIGTWRDYLSWLSQALGCFATANREGQIVLRAYGGEPVDTIDDSHRFTGASFSDYETWYTGMTVENIETQTTSFYHVDPDDGLTYNLGANPFLQYGTEETYTAQRQAVLDALQSIRFVPFKATAIGNPAYDLGDVLVFSNGIADGTKRSCITKFVFCYNDKYEMQGVGSDPRLASVRTKEEREINRVSDRVNAKDIIVHSFTNASAITLASEKERELISINYAAITDTRAIFLATIPVTVDRDGYIVIKYYIDGVLQEGDTLRQYVERGEHFVTISTNRAIKRNSRATLSVRALTEYIESDIRQQSAKIASILDYIDTGTYTEQAIDTTAPKMTIAKQAIKAVLYAQGLTGSKEWDGTLTLVDEYAPVQLQSELSVIGIRETVVAGVQVPIGSVITEAFTGIRLDSTLIVGGITEQIGSESGVPIDFVMTQQTVDFGMTEYTENVDGVTKLKTEYVAVSMPGEIDEGYVSVAEVVTVKDGYQSVESVVIE